MNISIRTAALSNNRQRPNALWAKLNGIVATRRQRHALAQLDDHLLADIGITRGEAAAESSKKAWDVPNHWRK